MSLGHLLPSPLPPGGDRDNVEGRIWPTFQADISFQTSAFCKVEFVICQNHCSPWIAVANCEQWLFHFICSEIPNKFELELASQIYQALCGCWGLLRKKKTTWYIFREWSLLIMKKILVIKKLTMPVRSHPYLFGHSPSPNALYESIYIP